MDNYSQPCQLADPNWSREEALKHSLRATDATNNIQEIVAPKHPQDATVADKDQEMRALERSTEEVDAADELRYKGV